MTPIEIVPGVRWIGAMHPDLRIFDDLLPTRRGTTYNSYLVGEEEFAVVDTVKGIFAEDYISGLSGMVDLNRIKAVVVHHTEPDHSGSLGALLDRVPKATVHMTKPGRLYLKDLLNRPVEACTIDECTEISIGDKTLRFIPAPFLHWPDTMFTYLVEDRILFTCDAFGTHFSDERMFDDLVDDFEADLELYYDTIVRPFRGHVLAALEKIKDLDVRIICPSHGPILRTDPARYVEKYRKLATLDDHPRPYIVLIYMTAHGNTGRMVQAVAEGMQQLDVEVDVLHITEVDDARVRRAMENADGLVFGVPTMVRDVPPPMWHVLSLLSTVQLRAKCAAALGSYGWSGEARTFAEQRLKDMRLKVCEFGLRKKFTPTEESLQECRKFGEDFAAEVTAGE